MSVDICLGTSRPRQGHLACHLTLRAMSTVFELTQLQAASGNVALCAFSRGKRKNSARLPCNRLLHLFVAFCGRSFGLITLCSGFRLPLASFFVRSVALAIECPQNICVRLDLPFGSSIFYHSGTNNNAQTCMTCVAHALICYKGIFAYETGRTGSFASARVHTLRNTALQRVLACDVRSFACVHSYVHSADVLFSLALRCLV